VLLRPCSFGSSKLYVRRLIRQVNSLTHIRLPASGQPKIAHLKTGRLERASWVPAGSGGDGAVGRLGQPGKRAGDFRGAQSGRLPRRGRDKRGSPREVPRLPRDKHSWRGAGNGRRPARARKDGWQRVAEEAGAAAGVTPGQPGSAKCAGPCGSPSCGPGAGRLLEGAASREARGNPKEPNLARICCFRRLDASAICV